MTSTIVQALFVSRKQILTASPGLSAGEGPTPVQKLRRNRTSSRCLAWVTEQQSLRALSAACIAIADSGLALKKGLLTNKTSIESLRLLAVPHSTTTLVGPCPRKFSQLVTTRKSLSFLYSARRLE